MSNASSLVFYSEWGRVAPKLLYVELEHKMFSELVVYFHQYFSVSLFSKNVPSDPMKTFIIRKCNSQRKLCNRPLFTEIREGCLTANLPIYNRTVNILLEAITLKPFLQMDTKLGSIGSGNKRKLSRPWEVQKVVMSLSFVTKAVFQWKISKIHTWWIGLEKCRFFLWNPLFGKTMAVLGTGFLVFFSKKRFYYISQMTSIF